jgi:hypothetical protein
MVGPGVRWSATSLAEQLRILTPSWTSRRSPVLVDFLGSHSNHLHQREIRRRIVARPLGERRPTFVGRHLAPSCLPKEDLARVVR